MLCQHTPYSHLWIQVRVQFTQLRYSVREDVGSATVAVTTSKGVNRTIVVTVNLKDFTATCKLIAEVHKNNECCIYINGQYGKLESSDHIVAVIENAF